MSVGIATIAAFLLLLPGIAFIVGVNIADKNVREIVFRNTPAELGYVIATSLVVHLLIALASATASWFLLLFSAENVHAWFRHFSDGVAAFNAGTIYIKSLGFSATTGPGHARTILIFLLSYFLCAALVGFVPGTVLGRWVRNQRWRWTTFFVKHRWMLDLIQTDELSSVSARVVLKDKFRVGGDAGVEHPIIIQGVLRESYFGADGKLLYLVFRSFVVLQPDGSRTPYFGGLGTLEEPGQRAPGRIADQLLIEGDKVELVRYSRRVLPLDQLAEAEGRLAAQSDPPPSRE